MAGEVGLEPTTQRLTAARSTNWAILPYLMFFLAGALGLEPRVPVLETGGLPINRYPYGVDSKNRTYMTRVTIWRSAIELYQPYYWRAESDSNWRTIGLQPMPLSRLGICSSWSNIWDSNSWFRVGNATCYHYTNTAYGGGGRIRTRGAYTTIDFKSTPLWPLGYPSKTRLFKGVWLKVKS